MQQENKYLVKATNISKIYNHQPVLSDINLEVKKGDRIGIVGPNGSGKTTLCEILAQLRRPSSGQALKEYGVRIGMQLQESKYPKGTTAYDILNLYLKTYKLYLEPEIILNYLTTLNVKELMNKDISKLSGGQQQRINILLALIINPDLIILDELATGLDLESKERIYELLSQFLGNQEKGLIIISHNMDEIQNFCDTLIFMMNGVIQKISNVQEIVREFGTVEKFVKEKFKEYQIQPTNISNNNLNQEVSNDKWAKQWKKYVDKNKK
ncbi:ATP-binding cassette domain-containing protein [Spiroplasma chrysopicola]|uniref:ABC transporter ATP-binding protein n=1 Tax=Spiroplasma chrysopicola DF-1 TaxID=1276227 RepID=R4UIE4_9MOLU|nr:ABC transporter ATP-binding protein [Spiroplasma chrysopicola]AGM25086.1 ABC transporter ATP-binding protein [Spiroplasma chrysopicola DF-1]